jgi:hypothetical protein
MVAQRCGPPGVLGRSVSLAWRLLAATGSALAVAGLVHAAGNLRSLHRPEPPTRPIADPVAVLIPARDEAHRVGATVTAALAQRDVPHLQVVVLDDASTDGTSTAAAQAGDGSDRFRIIRGDGDPPTGWLGKPYACQRLADAVSAPILVFLDADVVLQPDAVAASVATLRADGAAFGSVWPRQLADGVLPRLIQPLQQWSWATTLPLRAAAASPRPSLAAANGQFLVIAGQAYEDIGGHAAVADCVLEDIELARAMKRAGHRTGLWDGSRLAECRMYDTPAELLAGYRKSLWAAFGPRGARLPVRAAAAGAAWVVLGAAAIVPAVAAVVGPDRGTRLIGLLGYLAGVGNRALVAHRTGSPAWPDSAAHPASVAALILLSADSLIAHATGRTSWKGRVVEAAA